MEVAGVVLGSIPLIISALEKYGDASRGAKDYWRYDSTLKDIKNHIIVQEYQLDITLSNIAPRGSSIAEIELYLHRKYPEDKCDAFIDILAQMHRIILKLMDKLDIDAQGKPKWDEVAPGRMKWEWRRVNRSFGSKARKSLIDELQYWNSALKNCFEKQEIPSEGENRKIQELQAQFDPQQCDTVRENSKAIYKALHSGWGCLCPQPHCCSLLLKWHNEKLLAPTEFNLALSYRKEHSVTAQNVVPCDLDECWQKLLIRIDDAATPASASLTPTPVAINEPADCNPFPSRRIRFGEVLGVGRTRSKSNTKLVKSSHSGPSSIVQDGYALASSSPLGPPNPSLISGLCELLQNCTTSANYLGYLPDMHSSPFRRIQIHKNATKPYVPKLVPITSFLSPANQQFIYQLGLSRKDRFGIAASAVWAVLFLCGSPWLSEKLDQGEIQLILDDLDVDVDMRHEHTGNICVSHRFHPVAVAAISSTPLSAADQLQDTQILNKTLFSLGILLIELCLNRPFAELRHENQIQTQSLRGARMQNVVTGATPSEDYAVAVELIDKVYQDAGNWYGYAVQRCIKCEFPGRDVTKNFQFKEFRTNFFTGVVAPIQATFDRMAKPMVKEAERRRDPKQGMIVVEATGGSTSSSLAFVCVAKGYDFHVVSSNAFASEKLHPIEVFRAALEVVPSLSGQVTKDLILSMIQRAKEVAEKDNFYHTDHFRNQDAFVGYSEMANELIHQFPHGIDAFCSTIGTAGMAIGVVAMVLTS